MKQFLFVCQGNICRSPALMGYMNHLIKSKQLDGKVHADSCGLYASFLNSPPDERMQEVARTKGIELDHHSKLFEASYFDQFDAIFGVTKGVCEHLKTLAHSKEHLDKIHLVTDYSPRYQGRDIPDPYYLGPKGFEKIWEMIESSCHGVLESFCTES